MKKNSTKIATSKERKFFRCTTLIRIFNDFQFCFTSEMFDALTMKFITLSAQRTQAINDLVVTVKAIQAQQHQLKLNTEHYTALHSSYSSNWLQKFSVDNFVVIWLSVADAHIRPKSNVQEICTEIRCHQLHICYFHVEMKWKRMSNIGWKTTGTIFSSWIESKWKLNN